MLPYFREDKGQSQLQISRSSSGRNEAVLKVGWFSLIHSTDTSTFYSFGVQRLLHFSKGTSTCSCLSVSVPVVCVLAAAKLPYAGNAAALRLTTLLYLTTIILKDLEHFKDTHSQLLNFNCKSFSMIQVFYSMVSYF